MQKVILGLFIFSLLACRKKEVDLIVYNAHIQSVDSSMSECTTMIIDGGKILAIGGDTLLKKYNSTDLKDAKQQFIYPGFIDAHCHFSGYALDAAKVDLIGSKSMSDIIFKCEQYQLANKQTWIEGRQWDENIFTTKEPLTKDSLDKHFPNIPVFLLRIDGHAALCNQKALDIAGIYKDTTIDGGFIEFKNGKATGLLVDNAMAIVKNKIPALNEAQAADYFAKTEKEFYKNGVTSFVDCMVENNWMHWLQNAYQSKKINIKGAYVLTNSAANVEEFLNKDPLKEKRYSIVGFKIFADGSLGSRGAYLLENYEDKKESRGYLTTTLIDMETMAGKIARSEYQLLTHAIGDAANREVLRIYAKNLNGKNDRRWRIEHAQVVDKNDVHFFADYSIIPSVQPTHAISDMLWVKNRIGSHRSSNAYAYNLLLQQNNWLPLGTDFPVEYLNPINTFLAAVFRTDSLQNPKGGFQIENALSRENALRGMTIWAAKSVFNEQRTGSLEVGKDADFVIFTADLLKDDFNKIRSAKLLDTYVDGEKK